MDKEQGTFLSHWAEGYQMLSAQEGLDIRFHEPYEFDLPLPDTIHRCTLLVPMTVIRLAAGTEYIDGQFVEYEESEPVVCTYDEANQSISVEVRVESQFFDADDLHFRYYQQGFDDFVEQTTDLRLLGDLESQLGFDPATPAYERIRHLTHIASGNFRTDGKKSLSYGFSATIAELEDVFEIIPKQSPLFANLNAHASDQERWDFFVTMTLTAAVDSIRAIYPTLYRYMYYWYDEGEDRAAYEHMVRGLPIRGDHSNVFDEAMEITHGRMVENSRYYHRLAKERLAASPYWIGQWALEKLKIGTLQSARLADPVFEERDDPRLLICSVRVPIYYYDHDEVAGETTANEDILIYWDDTNREAWIEMRQLGNFGLGQIDDTQLQALNDAVDVQRGRFGFFLNTLAYQTDDHSYIAYGRVVSLDDAQEASMSIEDAVEGEVVALMKAWKHVLHELKTYRMDELGMEY